MQPTGLAEMKRLFGNDVTRFKFRVWKSTPFRSTASASSWTSSPAKSRFGRRPRVARATQQRSTPARQPDTLPAREHSAGHAALGGDQDHSDAGLTLVMHELDNALRQIYTDGRPHPVDPTHRGLGIRLAGGTTTCWSSRRSASTARPRSTSSVTHEASPCGSRNDTGGATSGTSTSRSR